MLSAITPAAATALSSLRVLRALLRRQFGSARAVRAPDRIWNPRGAQPCTLRPTAGRQDQSDDRERINGSRNSIYRVIISAAWRPAATSPRRDRNLLLRRLAASSTTDRRGTLTVCFGPVPPACFPSSCFSDFLVQSVALRQKRSIRLYCIDVGSSYNVRLSCKVAQLCQNSPFGAL